jgi:hypothetical protein
MARIFPAIWIALALAPAWHAKEIHRTAPLAADGRVILDTYRGSIDIETWDRAEIAIHARIEPDRFAPGAEEQVLATEVRIDAAPNSTRIRTDHRALEENFWMRLFGGGRPAVHYTIRMPRTARLLLRDNRSEIRIGDLRGELDLNTYRGSAVIASVDGPMRLETNRGRIRVEDARITARSRVETYRGEVELAIPRGSAFDIDADLGRRASLSGKFASALRGRSKDRRIAGRVNGGGPTLKVRCERGALRLRET